MIVILCFTCLSCEGKAVSKQYQRTHVVKKVPKPVVKKIKLADQVRMDVPLINQMDNPKIYNGCEVTSLAMLLNYAGVDVTKSELAEALPKVPYLYYSGLNGDPNEGFVGNIYGGAAGKGYFVYHKPIFDLAEKYLPDNLKAVDLTGKDFRKLQENLTEGRPVWVITTSTFSKTTDVTTWKTKSGDVRVSMQEHSVLLTGYDKDSVYLNNPYGNKDFKTDRKKFVESWEQMGSQAIVVIKK